MKLPITPLSDEWEAPKGTGHKFLVQYLIAQQSETYGTYYQDLSNKILVRNMKLLCKKYSEDDIKRAIALGCVQSEHPFSTKFIEDVLLWLLDVRSCPIIQFFQNKS